MKHIELKMLTIQDWVTENRIGIMKVPTDWNPSDLLTKGLAQRKLVRFGRTLRLRGGCFDDPRHDWMA